MLDSIQGHRIGHNGDTIVSFTWLRWSSWNICVSNHHGYVPLDVNTFRSFPHSWLIIGFVSRVTRRVQLVEQKLVFLAEYLNSPPVLVGSVLYSIFSFMCNVLLIVVCHFVPFLLVIVVFVLLRFTDSDYHFGIFKLFLLYFNSTDSLL